MAIDDITIKLRYMKKNNQKEVSPQSAWEVKRREMTLGITKVMDGHYFDPILGFVFPYMLLALSCIATFMLIIGTTQMIDVQENWWELLNLIHYAKN